MNNTIKCPVYKYCGGCQYQGIDYLKQLDNKQKQVNKILRQYGKVNKILGNTKYLNYRNKVQVSFGYDENKNVICGNYIESTHIIVPIDDCMICDAGANKIITSIKKLINKYKISVFDENSLKGCIRHVLIRATNNGEYMVILVTGSLNISRKEEFIKDIVKFNKSVVTIVQNINNRHTSMVLGNKNIILYGKGYITDKLCGLNFKISPSSFYQINKYQTETLYDQVIKAANIKQKDIVIDAYCGTGTIGLVASKYCKEVLGIELNKYAVKDAITNAKINKIKNISFINEDAGKYMSFLAKKKVCVDLVIMDPPRTGSDIKFLSSLFKLKPNRIVYVSCNPETLKRDLSYLTKQYNVEYIQPVDMFPYTSHVECVVGMQIKDK